MRATIIKISTLILLVVSVPLKVHADLSHHYKKRDFNKRYAQRVNHLIKKMYDRNKRFENDRRNEIKKMNQLKKKFDIERENDIKKRNTIKDRATPPPSNFKIDKNKVASYSRDPHENDSVYLNPNIEEMDEKVRHRSESHRPINREMASLASEDHVDEENSTTSDMYPIDPHE